jgi:twitching motility protein PilT
MRLIPRQDGNGRVPAVEVMMASSLIRECITDPAKTKLIRDYIEQGRVHYGMQSFDQSILQHYRSGAVSFDEALKWATNPEDFKLKVKGVRSTAEIATDEDGPSDESGDIRIERFQK